MRRGTTRANGVLLLFALGLSLSLGCGPSEEPGGGGGTGPVCYQDSDCVPDGCCGSGTGAVIASQAPSCSSQTCTNSCPLDQVRCGCGIPVCKDSHCDVALTAGPNCP